MEAANTIPNSPVIPSFRIDPANYPKSIRDSVRATHLVGLATLAAVTITTVAFAAAPLWTLPVPILVSAFLVDKLVRSYRVDVDSKTNFSNRAQKINDSLRQTAGVDLKALNILDKFGNLLTNGDEFTFEQKMKCLIQDVENVPFSVTLAKYSLLESDFSHVHSRSLILFKLCEKHPAFREAFQNKWLAYPKDERVECKPFHVLMVCPQIYGFELSPVVLEERKKSYAKYIFETFLRNEDTLLDTGYPDLTLLGTRHGSEIFRYVPEHLQEQVNKLFIIFIKQQIRQQELSIPHISEDNLRQLVIKIFTHYVVDTDANKELKINEIFAGWLGTKVDAFLEDEISYFNLCKILNDQTLLTVVVNNLHVREKIAIHFAVEGVKPAIDCVPQPQWREKKQESECVSEVYPHHAYVFGITNELMAATKYKRWHQKSMDECLSPDNKKVFIDEIMEVRAVTQFTKKALDWCKESPEKIIQHPELFRIGILNPGLHVEGDLRLKDLIDQTIAELSSPMFFVLMEKFLEKPEDVPLIFGHNNPVLGKLTARLFLDQLTDIVPLPSVVHFDQLLPEELKSLFKQNLEELSAHWKNLDEKLETLHQELEEALKKIEIPESLKLQIQRKEEKQQFVQEWEGKIKALESNLSDYQKNVQKSEQDIAILQLKLNECKLAISRAKKDQKTDEVEGQEKEAGSIESQIKEVQVRLQEEKKSYEDTKNALEPVNKQLYAALAVTYEYPKPDDETIAYHQTRRHTKEEIEDRREEFISCAEDEAILIKAKFIKALQQFLDQKHVPARVRSPVYFFNME